MERKAYIAYFRSWYIVYITPVADNSRKVTNWLTGEWLTEWVTDCLSGLFADLRTDWRVSTWLTDSLTHSRIEQLTVYLSGWFADWLIGWLTDRRTDLLPVWIILLCCPGRLCSHGSPKEAVREEEGGGVIKPVRSPRLMNQTLHPALEDP